MVGVAGKLEAALVGVATEAGDLPPSENRKEGVEADFELEVGVSVERLTGESKEGSLLPRVLYSFARSTCRRAGGQDTNRFCAIVILGVRNGAADLTGEGGSGLVIRRTRTSFVTLLTDDDREVLREDVLDPLEDSAWPSDRLGVYLAFSGCFPGKLVDRLVMVS